MQTTLRLIRSQPPPTVLSSPKFGRKICGVRFQQALAGNNPPESGGGGSMDQSAQNQKMKQGGKGEPMSSFGEGYSTRSDEEGFGGNQELPKDEEEKIVNAKVPEFDSNQGSEVKEKEELATRKILLRDLEKC